MYTTIRRQTQATNKPATNHLFLKLALIFCWASQPSQSVSRPVLVLLTYFSPRFNGNNDNDVLFTVMMRMTTTTYYSDSTFSSFVGNLQFVHSLRVLSLQIISEFVGFKLNFIRPMKLFKVLQ